MLTFDMSSSALPKQVSHLFLATALALFGLSVPAVGRTQTKAVRASDFLDSIGANSSISRRGESLDRTIDCARYLGLRWFRSGAEGDFSVADFIELHQKAGVRFSWGGLSGGSDLPKVITTAKQLAAADALLAFEGPNEPNNWGITYNGQAGGRNLSWVPVANLQRDLYQSVKSDPILKRYPVWGISEEGAETDNVGLQFLTVPPNSGALVPAGTKFSDFANVHNYVYHPNSPGLEDNKTWNAADPTSACRVDGLYGEYGVTWAHHYQGYSAKDLLTLPRVTTETGCAIDGPITERIHGLNLMSLYLDQFKRGWSHTAVYLLRDRVDEAGNQQYGFYKPDYSPRFAAIYLHNLTTVLADHGSLKSTGQLDYQISNEPATVHDLLLEKSDGTFELVVWSELVAGKNEVKVNFAMPVLRANVYDTTAGTEAVQHVDHVKTLELSLTDHPVIIEIPGAKKHG
jgi:hypothetical protein